MTGGCALTHSERSTRMKVTGCTARRSAVPQAARFSVAVLMTLSFPGWPARCRPRPVPGTVLRVRLAVHRHRSRGGPVQAHDRADRRGLARPFGPRNPGHHPRPDGEGQAVDCRLLTERLISPSTLIITSSLRPAPASPGTYDARQAHAWVTTAWRANLRRPGYAAWRTLAVHRYAVMPPAAHSPQPG